MAKRKLVPRTRCSNTMTEAEFRSWVVSGLRTKSRWWKPMQDAKKEARTGNKVVNPDTGRLCIASRCAVCGQEVPEKHIHMDHEPPVVDPEVGFVDWGQYIDRMFPEKDGYQAVCKPCHKQKTADERKIRTERQRREKAAKENR